MSTLTQGVEIVFSKVVLGKIANISLEWIQQKGINGYMGCVGVLGKKSVVGRNNCVHLMMSDCEKNVLTVGGSLYFC